MTDKPAQTRLEMRAHGLCQEPRIRQSIWRHCLHLNHGTTVEMLDTDIPPGCQMLGHSLQHHQDANAAVSQYFNVALQQYHTVRQLLNLLRSDPGSSVFLDFACGYGRLLRFLRHVLPTDRIHAAEIQQDAVHYVTERFGIPAMVSTPAPEDFRPARTFDFIWVASLFSHLPEPLFRRWLARLFDLLTPNGILCFSAHDISLLPAEITPPASGILFGEGSEIPELGAAIYGTTYVSDAFVGRVIAQACGETHPWARLPKALAQEQDIYVLPRAPTHSLSALKDFRRGPWGWVDERYRDGEGIYLRGWAASLDDGPLDHVEIRVNNHLHHCTTEGHRQDVADHFRDPRLTRTGWSFRLPLPHGAPAPHVEVSARSREGELALLYTGIMD